MVHMNTKVKDNNARLRELIEEAGLTQAEALDLFNKKMIKPLSLSGWKSYLADRDAVRWRRFDDKLLEHAEAVLKRGAKSG